MTLAFELQLSIDQKCIYLVASTSDLEASCKLISMQVHQMIPKLQRDEKIYTWHTVIASSRTSLKTSTQNLTRNSAAAEKLRDALYCLEILFTPKRDKEFRIVILHWRIILIHSTKQNKWLTQQNGPSCRVACHRRL